MVDVVASLRESVSTHRRWWMLVAACLGVLIAIIDVTIVNVALPTMQRDLHARFSALQWIINVYNLALAVTLPLGGRIGDSLRPQACLRNRPDRVRCGGPRSAA